MFYAFLDLTIFMILLINPLGHANIQRLNGESAPDFRMRLQARLGQLAALDTYIVNEVETIRSKMQKTIQSLRDIELKRMQIDLQVDTYSCILCKYSFDAFNLTLSIRFISIHIRFHSLRRY